MKKIFLLICIVVNCFALAQSTDSAFYFVNSACQYDKAIIAYQKKIKTFRYKNILDKKFDLYNLACAYSLKNNESKVYETLKLCFKTDTASGYMGYVADPDFYNVVNKKLWRMFLKQNTPTRYKMMNDTLFYNLSKIAIQDQALYKKLNCTEHTFGSQSKEVNKIWDIKDSLNKSNLFLIEKYLADSVNVLSNAVVGENFANHCFLVIQHSDMGTMSKYLPVIKNLYTKGETDGGNYALLYDRVMLQKEKGVQYYGSQVDLEKNIPYPILDEKNVDKRRKELGMEPIKDYLLRFGIFYKPKR
jgi:hypothetical protein